MLPPQQMSLSVQVLYGSVVHARSIVALSVTTPPATEHGVVRIRLQLPSVLPG